MRYKLIFMVLILLLFIPIAYGAEPATMGEFYRDAGAADASAVTVADVFQSFNANTTGDLTNVSLEIKNSGTPTTYTEILIWDMSGGLPNAQIANFSRIEVDRATASYVYYNSSGSVTIVKGNQYAVVMHSANVAANNHFFAKINSDEYAGGVCGTGDGSLDNWATATKECNFVTWFNYVASVPDTTKPIVNVTINNTSPKINEFINISANLTDETGLLFGNITINFTTGTVYFNYSLSGTSVTINNVTKITDGRGHVLNITVYATDSSNNVQQNSTLITVGNTVPVIPGPTTLVLQDADTETLQDTYTKQDNAKANFATESRLRVGPRGAGGSPRFMRPYLMFDLVPLPLGVQIDNATMFLFLNNSDQWNFYGTSSLQVNHVINYTWIDINITHDDQMCGGTAGTIGGQCNSTAENGTVVLSTPELKFYNWTVISSLKREHANTTTNNISFVVHDDSEDFNGDQNPELRFMSKESSNVSSRPRLDVGYTSIYINPLFPGSNQNLIGNISITDVDGDSESGSTFKWYKNGVEIATETLISLASSNYVLNDVIIFEGTPSDGTNFGSPVNSSSVTVINLLPPAPTIILPTPDDYNDTQPDYPFNVVFEADPDGDALTIHYYINGVLNQTSANNVTFNASDGYYILNVSLTDGIDFTANTTVNFTIDTTLPTLLKFNLTNNTIIGFNVNLTLNITVQDTNPFNLSYTLSNSSKEIITAYNDVATTSTTISIVDTLNLTGLASGNYTLAINFSDRHTITKIDNYGVSINPNKITFNTAEGSLISIFQTAGGRNEQIRSNKRTDRYTIEFGRSDEIEQRKYLITSDRDIKILQDSEFKGHLIIGKNWMDFENNDATSSVSMKRLGNNMVMVTVNSRDFNFNSLGGLNVVNVFYSMQVDNDPPTSVISINDTTPLKDKVVNISANATDIIGISTIFIGHNNSGSWVNASNLTVTDNTTTFVNLDLLLTVTAAQGQTVGVLSCANDTANQFSCGTQRTMQVNDTTVPTIVSGNNVTRVLVGEQFNFTYNVTDNFLLSFGQVIITEDSVVRFFNHSLSSTSDEFSQNFTISGTVGSSINITGRVNDSFGNLAQTTTLLSITKDFGVNVSNLYDNTSILSFTAVLFNSTFNQSETTTDGSVTFNDTFTGQYLLNISSDENGGYHNITNLTVNVASNVEGRMHQAFVYFTAVRRGTNINVTSFSVSVPLAANTSNATGGLRLLVNATRLVGVGTSDDYFDRTVNVSPGNQSTLRSIIEFYDINVSISVRSIVNNSFQKNFTVSLTANNSNFAEELIDQNTGNVTFNLGNNTYNVIIDTPDHALFFASFFIGSNDTFPNLTFSVAGSNSINFSVFDEITEELIPGNTSISLISDAFAINDTTTDGGTLYLQGLPASDYRIEYDHDLYTKRDFYVTVGNSSNQTVDLYLLSTGNGTIVTFTVQDNSGNKLTNATIRLKRYYISTNSYRIVAMSRTNEEGDTDIDVDFNDAFYETLTTFEGFSLRTIGAKIISTTRILTIKLEADPFETVDALDSVTTSLTFNNVTQTFSYVFTQLKGINIPATLEVISVRPSSSQIVCTATDTTSSGTLLCQVNTTNSTGTYIANGYVRIANVDTRTDSLEEGTGIVSKLRDKIGEQGFFFAIMISGTLAGLGSLVSPAVAVVLFLVGIFISNFLGFSVIAASGLGLLVIITGVIVWRMRK